MRSRLGRNSITKTGRFLTSPTFNVLPLKSSFEARHMLTIHAISWIRAGGIYLLWHHISTYLTVQRQNSGFKRPINIKEYHITFQCKLV